MTGLVRKAALIVAGGILIAGAATAGVPNAANSTIPSCITVADLSLASICTLIPSNTMIIRDALNIPVANATVVLDFTTCAPDAGVEECDVQPDPTVGTAGVTEGPGEVLVYTTNGSGQLCVTVVGTGTNITPLASGRPVCCKIYAGSNLMGTVTVTVVTYDLDGSGQAGGFDGSLWINDFIAQGGAVYNSRADYDCSGAVGGFDGSLWIDSFGLFSSLPCTVLP